MQAEARRAHHAPLRVAIVDLDVHQGNGTARIFQGDPTVFTLSLHGAKNFPFRKEDGDLDVPLADGTGDGEYLDALATHLPDAIARARADAVVYLAGADPYAGDRLGPLALSKAGLAERDRQVFAACARHGLPVAVCMAGGYAPDVEDIVDIHEATVHLAAAHARRHAAP
jgi:acetoin utilization deacetylase AcuC-like enzyme